MCHAVHYVFHIFSKNDCCCSVAKSCLTLCNPMDCSIPGSPVLHRLLELAQTHVHWWGDAIQSSHPLPSPSPPAFNLSQNQGLFKSISSSHQVAKVLELQHQSFQWIFMVDFLLYTRFFSSPLIPEDFLFFFFFQKIFTTLKRCTL